VRLFHPAIVLRVALLLVCLLQGLIAFEYDQAARAASPREEQAGFPLDDAWIHQVYARSLAERLALEFNPGEPEAGQSSLLWVALLAPVQKVAGLLSIPVPRLTRLLGLLIWIALALLTALVVTGLPIPGARFGAFAAALLIALDPALAFASASGMEPLLLSLCLMLALLGLVRRKELLCGAGCALLVLARPEGVLPAALIAGTMLWTSGPGRAARFARVGLPPLLSAGLWISICLSISGRPFPNTYYVKASAIPIPEALSGSLASLAGLFDNSPFYRNYVGYLFLFIGLVALLARAGRRLNLVLLLAAPCYLFGVAATRGLPEPTAFFWERYLIPAIPSLSLLAAVGWAGAGAVLADLIRRPASSATPEAIEPEAIEPDPIETEAPAESDPDPRAEPLALPQPASPSLPVPDLVLMIVLAILILFPFGAVPEAFMRSIQEFGENVSDVDRMNVEAALWLRDEPLIRPEMVLATQDAGALRYFTSNERVVDLLGLNDHRLVETGLADQSIEPYLDRLAPRIMVLLDPDPGALQFWLYAARRGLREVARFGTDDYSLFGRPSPRALVVLADLPPG